MFLFRTFYGNTCSYLTDVFFIVLQGMYASEPIFVPNPEGTEEDDGIVLANVMNSNPGQLPFLLILDAHTFDEIARAEVSN